MEHIQKVSLIVPYPPCAMFFTFLITSLRNFDVIFMLFIWVTWKTNPKYLRVQVYRNHETSLDWHLLDFERHKGLQFCLKDPNSVYKRNSILNFMRFDKKKKQVIIIVVNLTPVPRHNYRVGVPDDGEWMEILNSDAKQYGGSGMGNFGSVSANPVPYHGEDQSVNILLPPLAVVMFSLFR